MKAILWFLLGVLVTVGGQALAQQQWGRPVDRGAPRGNESLMPYDLSPMGLQGGDSVERSTVPGQRKEPC